MEKKRVPPFRPNPKLCMATIETYQHAVRFALLSGAGEDRIDSVLGALDFDPLDQELRLLVSAVLSSGLKVEEICWLLAGQRERLRTYQHLIPWADGMESFYPVPMRIVAAEMPGMTEAKITFLPYAGPCAGRPLVRTGQAHIPQMLARSLGLGRLAKQELVSHLDLIGCTCHGLPETAARQGMPTVKKVVATAKQRAWNKSLWEARRLMPCPTAEPEERPVSCLTCPVTRNDCRYSILYEIPRIDR